jgi:hypothetical protein
MAKATTYKARCGRHADQARKGKAQASLKERADSLFWLVIDVGNLHRLFVLLQAGHECGEGEDAVANPVGRVRAANFPNEAAAERVSGLVTGMNFDVVEAGHVEDVRRKEIVAHDGAEVRRTFKYEGVSAGGNCVRLAERAVHARLERVALENAVDVEQAWRGKRGSLLARYFKSHR